MDEVSRGAGGPDADTCTDQFVLTTTGLKVVVLNRARDIVVKITIDLPLENLTWDGRNNRVLLYWEDIRVFKQIAKEEQVDCSSFAFGREVLLPCEVDFSDAVWVLNANHLILRLPKYVQELIQGPAFLSVGYCPNDEPGVAGEVPGHLAENRE